MPKYGHNAVTKWQLAPAETAVLCELLLRGPQTPGELRTHASRLHVFADPQQVEATLQQLLAKGGGPFVVLLPRVPGRREQRWAHLLGGDVAVDTEPSAPSPEPVRAQVAAEDARIAALEAEINSLKEELESLRSTFDNFRKQFE